MFQVVEASNLVKVYISILRCAHHFICYIEEIRTSMESIKKRQIMLTPRRKVTVWLKDQSVSTSECNCCEKRRVCAKANATTTAVRTKALIDRLQKINNRRNPLHKIDTDLAEKSRLLREKAKHLLDQSEAQIEPNPILGIRTKILQHRLVQVQKRVRSIKRRDNEFQRRNRLLKLKAREILNTSISSETPIKSKTLNNTFTRGCAARRIIRRVYCPRRQQTSTTSDSVVVSVTSAYELKTFMKGGLQCSMC